MHLSNWNVGDIVTCVDPVNFYCGRKVEILEKPYNGYSVIKVKVIGTNVEFVTRAAKLQ